MAGIHSIEYNNLTSYFYLFGVYQEGKGWYSWDEVEQLAQLLSILL